VGDGINCTDIDECLVNCGGCDPLTVCNNTPGGRTCGPCPAGYAGNGTSCVAVNECLDNNGGCGDPAYATCTNHVAASPSCSLITDCEGAPSGDDLCRLPGIADGTPCNDGNRCTLLDTCQGGVCVGGAPVACAATLACHFPGVCDPSTGLCSNPIPQDRTCFGRSTAYLGDNRPAEATEFYGTTSIADNLVTGGVSLECSRQRDAARRALRALRSGLRGSGSTSGSTDGPSHRES
jgi:hypothetical protein